MFFIFLLDLPYLLHLHKRWHVSVVVLVNERLHELVLSVLLQVRDALLKLGDALPRRLLKLLKALLRGSELGLKLGGVVGRNKLGLLSLGCLDGRVLKDDPEPRLVVDKPSLLLWVRDALLEVGRSVGLVPEGKVDVSCVVVSAILVCLGNKVHMMDFTKK